MVIESDTYTLDLLDELVEGLIPLCLVPVVCCLKLVSHLLRALVLYSCVPLLQGILELQPPLHDRLDLFVSDYFQVSCIGCAGSGIVCSLPVLTVSATKYPSLADVRWR